MKKYQLHPENQAGRWQRTLRIDGREPRLVVFTAGVLIDLDREELAALADVIKAEFIVPKGFVPPPKPKKEPPRRHPLEDDPDQPEPHIFDRPLPSEAHGVNSWARQTLPWLHDLN